jgi:hypothetical protein
MGRRKQFNQQEQQREHKNTLSQVTKQLSWFWGLERIWSFDCGVYAFALVLNVELRKLGWLEWRWLGGIYRLQQLPSHWLTLLSTGTPDSPVVQRTWHCSLSGACHLADHWGLERLTVEVICPLVAPDSPVYYDFAALTSDFCAAHCTLFIAVDRWAQLTIALLAHRTCLVHTGQSGKL